MLLLWELLGQPSKFVIAVNLEIGVIYSNGFGRKSATQFHCLKKGSRQVGVPIITFCI